jgi:hypothetical protein
LDRSCEKRRRVYRVSKERNVLHTIKNRKVNCIGRILRSNCLLKQIIEGTIEGDIEIIGRQ